jgi:4-amino-4-deoxy-L-arabinose transferase-like glycosyltransferase
MPHLTQPPSPIGNLKMLWLLSMAIAFFLGLGHLPLFDLDEGAFSQATREMFYRGDFLSTYLNGEPRYDKPILTYWLQAISISLFGPSEFAFRLHSALSASLWSLSIVLFTGRISTARTGYIAGIIMAGAAGIGIIGKAATADALLNLFLAGGLFCLYLYLTESKRHFLILAAACAGFGFITKGPFALLMLAVVSLLFSLWSGRFRLWLGMFRQPAAWATFLLIGAPWYLVLYLKQGTGFFENFLGTHNVGRFVSAMEGHQGYWWYYLPVILLIAFPFGFLFIRPLARFRQLIASDIGKFLLIWCLFVLIFFSFAATKLPHYMIYGMTPLFILAALFLDEKPGLFSVYLSLLLMIALMLALPSLIEHFLPSIQDPSVVSALENPQRYFPADYYLTLLLLAAFCLLMLFSNHWPRQGRLLIGGIIGVYLISDLLLPLAAKIQQTPIKQAGLIAAKYDNPAVMWHLNTPSFSVYSNRVVPNRRPEAGELVLTKTRYLDQLKGYEILYQSNGIALALVKSEHSPHDSLAQ